MGVDKDSRFNKCMYLNNFKLMNYHFHVVMKQKFCFLFGIRAAYAMQTLHLQNTIKYYYILLYIMLYYFIYYSIYYIVEQKM